MDPKCVVEVNHLTLGFTGEPILKDLNFKVNYGEIFVILGGSGCGKSTLMRHLIGLQSAMSGETWVRGVNMITATHEEKLDLLKRIGVMFQSGALFGSMTVLENVSLPLDELTDLPPEAKTRIALSKLALVGLQGYAALLPAELSGGMQKRVAIARAMVLDPSLVFLDEPSAGLDPITSSDIDRLILNLAEDLGITFIVVSHELRSIFAIADNVIMLDPKTKSIIAAGEPHDLREHTDNRYVKEFLTAGGEA